VTWREKSARAGAAWRAPEGDDKEDDGHDGESGGEYAVHADHHDGSHESEKGGRDWIIIRFAKVEVGRLERVLATTTCSSSSSSSGLTMD
jgi:hypothetical protein